MKELPSNNSKYIFFKEHIRIKLDRIVSDTDYSSNLSINMEELIIIKESLENIDDMKVFVDNENSLIVAIFNMERTDYKMSIDNFKQIFK